MSRPWRIEFEGAFYHVLLRGVEKRDVFRDNVDRLNFLSILGRMSERFVVDVYAYVLMPNHYHLLIKTNDPNLSRSMQWLGTTYTGHFNRRHNRSGHLFQGRFKSILVENDAYLIQLSCYIHRNPLRAGLVERLADYRWSSYLAYAYGRAQPEWLDTEFLLSQFTQPNKHKAYREKTQAYAEEEKRIWEDVRHGLLLGTEEFVDRIKATYLEGQTHKEIPQQRMVARNQAPEVLLSKMAEILNCDVEAFRRASRISKLQTEDRDLLIYILWEQGQYKNYEIGDLLGLGYSAVSRRASLFSSKLAHDQELRRKYEQIKSLIKM
jgi:putative transposase